MGVEKVNTVLIASGSGTDARAIMSAYASGCISNINLRALISTKPGAGCIEKAVNLGIQHVVVARKGKTLDAFNDELRLMLSSLRSELVFLVGCVVKVYLIKGVAMYNIHPADPRRHGGNKMYGLDVHRHVLIEIRDAIRRGMSQPNDLFYTYPTVHKATAEYDQGPPLLRTTVEIPRKIIMDFISKKVRLGIAAERLQKHVLPYEWIMLPAAVQLVAKQIIDERSG